MGALTSQCQNFHEQGGNMKGILTLVFFGLITSLASYADVDQARVHPNSGTANVDDTYVDELSTKKAAIEKDKPLEVDKTWNGQSQTYSKEDDQRMEERKDHPGGEAEQGRD
jgi:hypothetical protein